MNIRLATASDMNDLLEIYSRARAFMKKTGNPNQWLNCYPTKEILLNDIDLKQMYVVEDEDGIQASFVFFVGIDPTYINIENGQWLNEDEYGVIHRIASRGLKKHIGDIVLNYCFSKINNIRIDTHSDNIVMQKFLDKHGFIHVGTIYLKDSSSRLAFHCNLLKN